MALRSFGGWELWDSVHPSDIGCSDEGRDICCCAYHIVDEARTTILSFDDFASANTKFESLSGVGSFTLGKDSIDKFLTG